MAAYKGVKGVELHRDVVRFAVRVKGRPRVRINMEDFVTPRLKDGEKLPVTAKQLGEWYARFGAAVTRGEDPYRPPVIRVAVEGMTVGDLLDRYEAEHLLANPKKSIKSMQSRLKALHHYLGPLPLSALAGAKAINTFKIDYAASGLTGRKVSVTAVHRALEILRTACRWARRTQVDPNDPQSPPLLSVNPFTDLVSIGRAGEIKRDERINAEYQNQLLRAMSPWLQDCYFAALELLCRWNELSHIQIRHIDMERRSIAIAGRVTKSGRTHRVPYAAKGPLAAIIERRKHLGPLAYLVGQDSGVRRGNKDTAWENAVLRANGVTPVWTRVPTKSKPGKTHRALTPACREAFNRIDLHWHDLRHEGACRMHRKGVKLRFIQLMLNHASLEQTQRYLNVTDDELHEGLQSYFDTTQTDALQEALDVAALPRIVSRGGK